MFNKTYDGGNRVSDYIYDGRGNQVQGDGFTQVWDKRNRMSESRTATNVLLGSFTYNERGLRVKAIRTPQPTVQVIEPNGGESFHVGATDTISWSGLGLENALVKLELLKDGAVAGTIVENLPGTQTSFQWQAGKLVSGWAAAGTGYKVRVTAVVPVGGPETSYYFYDSGGRLLSEYDGTGACVKDYLYLGGKMSGEYQPASGAYYYYASDQINSTRMVTDSTGAVVHSAQYDPYGGLYKTWVDTYHPKPGFSGKEREFGSEMDYFGARYYGHGQYRFISTDPIINKDEAITDPQKWNLYAYCSNNPITRLDPDGRSTLTFDRSDQTITLYDNSGTLIGTYDASNNPTSGTSEWPTGTFTYSWHSPHQNAQDSDAISSSGNYIFNVPNRSGMGVHAGRAGQTDGAGRTGWEYATEGCIRTTEEAMTEISNRFQENDPLTQITINE